MSDLRIDPDVRAEHDELDDLAGLMSVAVIALFDSCRCSRYNKNTGRLTEDMFHSVFAAVRKELDA